MDKILYNIEKNIEMHPTCNDATIDVKVYKEGNYKYPVSTDGKSVVPVPAKDTRCNDAFHAASYTAPDLRLPDDFAVKAVHGVGIYVQNALQSIWVLGQTPGYDFTNKSLSGPVSLADFWFLFEAAPQEGTAALQGVKLIIEKQLIEEYQSSNLAFNATYAVTLVYTLFIFMYLFANCKKDLLFETRHNRNILFMIPLQVMVKCKPIIEYVERTFQELSSA